jgi:ABC-type lipoprotein release transport system permease subunit
MIRLAVRNLARNRWRSGLTLGGVAVAVAMLVWSESMTEAFLDTMVQSMTTQLGDVRIESEAHAAESSLYDAFPVTDALLERVRKVPGVRAAAPRLETFGLIGHESHSQAALILGVDPEAEKTASDAERSIVSGTWLSRRGSAEGTPADNEVVLGESLAQLLSAKVGDELVVLLQAADGSMGDDRLRVVGLARTGTRELDRQAAWMRLSDVAFLAALDGKAHKIMVRLERGADLDTAAAALRGAVAGNPGPRLTVRTWEQLMPDLRQMIDLSRLTMLALYGIVFLIAALGILNAQRMTALERRRELAVMMAVGVTPQRMAGLVVLEAVVLTGLGAAVGALLGWGLATYHAHAGLDLAALGSQGFTYQGVAFSSRMYFVVRPAMVLDPALAVLVIGALCGLWPAFASARLELARTISGRT